MGAALDASNKLSQFIPEIKEMVTNGHTAIIMLISLAILIGVAILIRQQKIMKMLRDLTPPKAEPPREEDTAAKETE